MRAMHLSRDASARHELAAASDTRGPSGVVDVAAARRAARRINHDRAIGKASGSPTVTAGELVAVSVLHEVFHRLVDRYDEAIAPGALDVAVATAASTAGRPRVERTIRGLARDFGRPPVPPGHSEPPATPEEARREALVEALLLAVINDDPAATPLRDLFDDRKLRREGAYPKVLEGLERGLAAAVATDLAGAGHADAPFAGRSLPDLLRAPAAASPTSLAGQLRWIRANWGDLIRGVDGLEDRLLLAADLVTEEERALHLGFGGGGLQPTETPDFSGLDAEVERFSDDTEWMPRVVLQAKATYVWLDQLSRRYGRDIRTLDAIPDEELDRLAGWGVTGLWLIGLWQRSRASQEIKHRRGNPDAVASAYSLDDYRIADDLGGEPAYANLRDRAAARGIRLASDMVPNHMGIDSAWVIRNPEWFLSVPEAPYPAYAFSGPDLSPAPGVEITLEDHYWDNSDAAVVFRRRDRATGDTRFIYHGNDGTSFPWNDTAQLDFLRAEVREAVIRTIVDVARRFPIIRFDAAMVLAKRHVRRLWWPEPGAGGGIPSRAEHALSQAAFEEAMPTEFWRDVVDRVAAEVPGTLLLAEAFWLMEGFFVRTLGMHRVYNSAFMHMLRDEDGPGYRKVIRDTIEFDPAILGRYVNFMSNPDEETALEQFGDGDKYFGVATVLATLPGLPMLGHGQVEGLGERYGMEFRRPTRDERPNEGLVERHAREIFPLLRERRRFAGWQAFRLYDLVTVDGVDEHVYAYTNGSGETRSLVLYLDRFASTSGRIEMSVPFAVKDADGSKRLEQTRLADALGLGTDPDAVVSFHDPRSGHGLVLRVGALRTGGLPVHLDAYAHRAYTEIVEHPAGDPDWTRLADRLGGEPVASLNDAILAVRLEGIHEPFLGALRAAHAGDLEHARPALAKAAAEAGVARADLEAVFVRRDRVLAGGAGRSHETARDDLAMEAWAALTWLPGGPASRRDAFDAWRLAWPIATFGHEAGLDADAAAGLAARVRLLLSVPVPGLDGVPGAGAADAGLAVAEAWLADPELSRRLDVHEHDGRTYVNGDAWNELAETVERLVPATSSARGAARTAAALRQRLVTAASGGGYVLPAVLTALTGPEPTPKSRRTASAAGPRETGAPPVRRRRPRG